MVSLIIFSLQISTIIIFITLSTSYGVLEKYNNCSSLVSCGEVHNIGYPFWGLGRAPYCGHPSLQLECRRNHSGDYPIITMVNQQQQMNGDDQMSYRLLGVQKSSSVITIQVQELNPHTTSSCPVVSSNTSLCLAEWFDCSSSVGFISLFYDCRDHHQNMEYVRDSITCGNTTYNYYLSDTSNDDYRNGSSCELIKVPVLRKELEDLNEGKQNLRNVLKQGFEVDYYKERSTACFTCERSGGICGSFACFCTDGAAPDKCRKSGKPTTLKLVILGLGSSGGGVLIILSFLVFCLRKRRLSEKIAISWKGRGEDPYNVDAFLKIYGSLVLQRYTYSSIKKMTNYFKNKLGEGGYATVYKGKLCNDRLVAVKLFKQTKGDGKDFINEVVSISRTNHVNIVTLLGFCFEGKKRALIYEFMPNGSLEKFTYRGGSNNMSLPWETLFNIVVGIARGLEYMHRGCNARILHFDIKPHNILLDEEFHPKISDFGLARCTQQESTISMLEARGTIGYIAPEVFCRGFGGVSSKSDVYSYGMVVLDLVCGRTTLFNEVQSNSELYFPHWIYNRLELGQEVADYQGTTTEKEKELQRKMILVGLWCIQTYPSNRPSMSRVLEMLNECIESIEMPPKSCTSSATPSMAWSSGASLGRFSLTTSV